MNERDIEMDLGVISKLSQEHKDALIIGACAGVVARRGGYFRAMTKVAAEALDRAEASSLDIELRHALSGIFNFAKLTLELDEEWAQKFVEWSKAATTDSEVDAMLEKAIQELPKEESAP